jgi:hypothetical protein
MSVNSLTVSVLTLVYLSPRQKGIPAWPVETESQSPPNIYSLVGVNKA